MEALAARTDGGTYAVVIERDKGGDVGRLELHLALNPGDVTDGIRAILREVAQMMSGQGERELQARMYELATGLEQQDQGRLSPAEEAGGGMRAMLITHPAALILQNAGDKKINIIKLVREATGLGLKEAKDLIEEVPSVVKRFATKDEADRVARDFVKWGATVTVE